MSLLSILKKKLRSLCSGKPYLYGQQAEVNWKRKIKSRSKSSWSFRKTAKSMLKNLQGADQSGISKKR